MKKNVLISALLFCNVVLSSGQPDNNPSTGKPTRDNIPDHIRNTKAFKRAEWFFNQRAFPYDTLPAVKYSQEMTREINKARSKSSKEISELNWSSVGPAGIQTPFENWGVIGGRVRAVAVHPSDPLTIYIGAASGGIWKTTDGGSTWLDIGHGLEALSFGAIAIDPANPEIIYAGSGECNLLEDFYTYSGNGLYKSTNGGETWILITDGFGSQTHFSDLVVSPYNSNVVMASLGGGTVYSGVTLPNEGVWKSLDGGITWNRTLDVQDASDIAFHPSNSNIVYAAAGGYLSPLAGFYISNDQGATWVSSNTGLQLPPSGGRMQFDIARSQPNIIYAVIYDLNFNPGVAITRAFKSTNGGNNWFQISAGTNLGGYYAGYGWLDQGWYDLCIAVDPVNPNHVLIGNVELHRTTNGSTFTPVRPFGPSASGSLVHVDYHKLVYSPSSPNYLYIGCDGGIYKSTDKGYTASSQNLGLETLQFYRIASHPNNPGIIIGGMQDNGSARTINDGANWSWITGSDAMVCLFNPNPDTVYTSSQYGQLYRSINGGNSFSTMFNVNGGWITPFLMHPVNHKVLYSANRKIMKSINAGASFQAISGSTNVSPANITTMAQSQVNPANMIFGTGMDHPLDSVFMVKISINEGVTWNDVTANIPGESRWISRVLTDPLDANTMYVLRTGFSPGNKVWKTINLGMTWTNISGDLPDLPCNDLFIDPENVNHLYVANDMGVYRSTDGGMTWNYASEGMPFVPAIDFDYVNINSTRYLRVGTHGRSIYETTLPHYCLPEGITFHTQAEIDNFQTNYPGCTHIEGNVRIEGDDISNLNGLSVLTSIGDTLHIVHNWSLGSLAGLNNLTSIGGSLEIYGGNQTDLTGLAGLNSIGGSLEIYSRYYLTSLTGLEGLTSIGGGLVIYGNYNLVSLAGLENLSAGSITNLSVTDNHSLSTCSIQGICTYLASPGGIVNIQSNATGCNSISEVAAGCGITMPCLPYGNYNFCSQADVDNFQTLYPGCTALEGNVAISGNDITNLNGLSAVTSIAGGLTISNNPFLASLTGLGSLTSIGGDLQIYSSNLTSLTGLENLDSIGGSFSISSDDHLTSLNGMEGLTCIGGDLEIHNNYSLNNLTGLDNLTSIGEDLSIGGTGSGNPSLTSLTGLSSLTSIGGDLMIQINASLVSLSGLENIAAGSIANLSIRYNLSLSACSIQGICNYLASPGGTVDILQNASGCNSISEVAAGCGITMPCLPYGNYNFYSQADVDNFQTLYPGCTDLEGDVIISGNDISNLNGLNGVNSIAGGLTISYNPSLASLTGLENLTTIGGGLEISFDTLLTNMTGLNNLNAIGGDLVIGSEDFEGSNFALTSLTGMENLQSIGGSLSIQRNNALINLAGLDGLTSLGGALDISYNSVLASLTGLQGLISLTTYLGISGNAALTNLAGLDGLTSLGGTLYIYYNPLLTNLTGLEGLTSIGGGFYINDNISLVNVTGLENLTSVGGSLAINRNNTLGSLIGLGGLTSIGGNLHVGYYEYSGEYGNPSLKSLTGLESITTIGGSVRISDNDSLVSLAGLDNLLETGQGLYISGNAHLASLEGPGNLHSVGGDIIITQNASLNDLSGLSNLASIGGNLEITDNDALTSLADLTSLTALSGSLTVAKNHILPHLSGLDNLAEVEGDIYIGIYGGGGGNPGLTSLHGLEALHTIGGGLNVNLNFALADLSALNGLTSVGGNLLLIGTIALPGLAGLENLASIGGDLSMKYDIGLHSIAALDGLTSIGGFLEISYNDSLTSLVGLDNINAGSIANLIINDNNGLSTCEVQSVCDYLASPSGTISISNNAAGCNSQAEVEAACMVSVENIVSTDQFLMFPNPADKTVTISSKNGATIEEVVIYTQTGQKVLQGKPVNNTLDISKLPPGMYIIELGSGQWKTRKKLMVE